MATREEDRFEFLVQKVFSTAEGEELIIELHTRYCEGNFDENPYAMARNCGQSDLIIYLMTFLTHRK